MLACESLHMQIQDIQTVNNDSPRTENHFRYITNR